MNLIIRTILLIVFLCPNFTLISQVPQWIKPGGGSAGDQGNAITTDLLGSIFVVGTFSGSANFDGNIMTSAGSSDMYWARYDYAGNLLQLQPLGDQYFDQGEGIHVDDLGNIYISGLLSDFEGTNIFLTKISPSGNLEWFIKELVDGASTSLGNALDVGTDASGNVYITGYFQGTAYFNDGAPSTQVLQSSNNLADIFTAKYSSSGELQWVTQSGGSLDDYGISILVTPNGDHYVSGSFSGSALIGGTTVSSAGQDDAFIAKFNANGNLIWVNKEGGSFYDDGTNLDIDPNGFVYLTGSKGTSSSGSFNGFVSKFNPFSGARLWTNTISSMQGADISVTSGDNYAVTGSDNNGNIVVKKFIGISQEWSINLGDTGFDRGLGITSDNTNFYITGRFENTLTGGDNSVMSLGQSDAFTMQITPSNYCASGTLSTDFGLINNVTLGTINNSSSNCATYSDFSAISSDVIPGQTVNFNITLGSCDNSNFQKAFKIFVDWNADADFEDTGEEVFISSGFGNGLVTGSFEVPASITGGITTRLRIVMINIINGDPAQDEPSDILSCGTYLYGETEDYSLNIIDFMPPTIQSFSPNNGYIGDPVTIFGSNFDDASVSGIKFNGQDALNYSIQDENTIIATPNIGTLDGPITIETVVGTTAVSNSDFAVNCAPTLSTVEDSSLPSSWLTFNIDGGLGIAIADISGPAGSTKSLFMNNYNYSSIGELDGIVIANLCVTPGIDNFLKFDLAYTYYFDGSSIGTDTLFVIDFNTGTTIWVAGGQDLATAPPTANPFIPKVSDWQSVFVDLNSLINILNTSTLNLAIINKNGFGNNLFIDNIEYINSPLLAINELYFYGEEIVNGIQLNWETIGELNNDYFKLERSDNPSNFQTIIEISGKGDGDHIYNYVDKQPNKGINYYRLTSIDFDGTEEKHDILSIDYGKSVPNEIKIFPNPNHGIFTVKPGFEGPIEISIYDSQSRFMQNHRLDNSEGYEIVASNLSPGVYFLKILIDNKNFFERIIVE